MKWIPLVEEHLEQVLLWRRMEHVTKVMFTNVENDIDEQRSWFQKIKNDLCSQYFIMEVEKKWIGLVSYSNIDQQNKRAIWHFYIGDTDYLMLGAFIDAYVYNYAFEILGLEKVICEVMDINESIQKIRAKYNVRLVGVYEKHILKDNEWHDVHLYEITRDNWFLTRGKFEIYRPLI